MFKTSWTHNLETMQFRTELGEELVRLFLEIPMGGRIVPERV
jgi:hypothetical protein